MMILGEILNFTAYSFVEGPFVSLVAPVTGSYRGSLSTAIVVVSIQLFTWVVSTS